MDEQLIDQSQELIHCADGTLADPSIGCVQTPEALVQGSQSLSELFIQVGSALATALAALATIAVIYGALHYLTSRGNQDQMDKGKRILFWSLFGLLLGLMGRFVLSSLLGLVGI